MADLIWLVIVLFNLVVGIGVLAGAYIIGTILEQRHFKRLAVAEQELSDILVTDLKHIPINWIVEDSCLVTGMVVIANDKFKAWIAGWIKLFGGRVFSYETLIERARREAIVRMLREARARSANALWNVRLETSTIHSRGKGGGIEVLAYGTALKVRK